MKLNQIADNPGARKTRHRIGRGIGSGCGKTGGRGGKGQTARSGVRIKGFEGGQMPLHRRLPKRGFKNTAFQIRLTEINIGDVQEAIDAGMLDAKQPDRRGRAGESRRAASSQGRREAARRRRDQDQGRNSRSGAPRNRRSPRSRRPAARSRSWRRRRTHRLSRRGKNARFAAGLDKPKVYEAAPKAEAKGDKPKADKPKADKPKAEKPAKPAGKDAG